MEQCQKCDGCSSHFSSLRPGIQDYSMSKHFPRDIDNYQQIMEKIMSCDKQGAEELFLKENFLFQVDFLKHIIKVFPI